MTTQTLTKCVRLSRSWSITAIKCNPDNHNAPAQPFDMKAFLLNAPVMSEEEARVYEQLRTQTAILNTEKA